MENSLQQGNNCSPSIKYNERNKSIIGGGIRNKSNELYYVTLRNNVKMPFLIDGLSSYGREMMPFETYSHDIKIALDNGVRAFDTSQMYGNSEEFLGACLQHVFQEGNINRGDVFITTKVGSEQQMNKTIYESVNESLDKLKIDYIDCLLLHWPVPNIWIYSWHQLEEIYRQGKVKSIGIANVRERHIQELLNKSTSILPHVVQVECHPFRSIPKFKKILNENNIRIQAYSSLLKMLPMVRENKLLNTLALKYNVSISAIILRWHMQQNVAPIFRTSNLKHMQDMVKAYKIELSQNDINEISKLDINYKFHPESVNCPGY